LVHALLKEYKTLIAAAHVAPLKLLADDVSLQSLVQLNHDGILLAKADPQISVLKIWNVDAGNIICQKDMGIGQINALRFNHTGDQLAVGWRHGKIHILDMQGNVLRQMRPYVRIDTLCYNDDGTLLASGGDSKIHIWDTNTAQKIGEVKGLASGSNVSLIVFKGDTVYGDHAVDACRWTLEEDNLFQMTSGYFERKVNNRGYYMWAAGPSKIYDVQTKRHLSDLNQGNSVAYRSFSEDGSRLAVASLPSGIQIYQCPSYEKAISSLSLLRALYVLKHLKAQESLVQASCNFILRYFLPRKAENNFCSCIHKSLSPTFKKIIE